MTLTIARLPFVRATTSDSRSVATTGSVMSKTDRMLTAVSPSEGRTRLM
jgi:hypothetical protein